MAREEEKHSLLGSAASHTWEAFVRTMKDQTGEVNLGDADPQPDANNDAEWDVTGQDPAGLDADPSPAPDTTPEPEEGEQPSPAKALKLEPGQEPEKGEGEKLPPFHEHPDWQKKLEKERENEATITELQGNMENLNQQLQFYAEQYNQVIGQNTEPQPGQPPATPIPGVAPQAGLPGSPQPQPVVQPQAPGQLPVDITGPATQQDAEGNPIGGWEDQQQIAQYMDHRANEIADSRMATAYTEKIAPVFDRFNQAITSMQDMLLNQTFPVQKDDAGVPDPNSGWDPAYKEALKDVFVMDDAGKVLAVKNQATLNYWQQQPFPKLAAIEHGMRKLAPQAIKEGKAKAIKGTLKSIGTKPKGPTTPTSSGVSPQDEVDIGWDAVPGSNESEAYLAKKGLI